jgi:hypothetical protein
MNNVFAIKFWNKSIQSFPTISVGFDLAISISAIALYDVAKIFNIYFAAYFWSFLSFVLKTLIALSIIYVLIQFKSVHWKALAPLILSSITFWVLFSSSYMDTMWNIRMKYELQLNKSKYEETITKIENQELKPLDENGYVRLSQKPRDFVLSNQGHETTSVFFDLGIGFHGYEGFMYRSDDTQPPTTEFMGTFWLSCKHQELYWYYCSSD